MEMILIVPYLAVALFVHEFGHWAAAYYTKQPVARMVVGRGRLLAAWYWRGMRFEWRLLPTGGYVSVVWRSSKVWKNVLRIASGPGANLLVYALLLVAGHGSELFALVNLYLGVFNLLPTDKDDDGSRLIEELSRMRKRKAGA